MTEKKSCLISEKALAAMKLLHYSPIKDLHSLLMALFFISIFHKIQVVSLTVNNEWNVSMSEIV